eukprot:757856-Hanusia_phi.AAC.1
MDERFEMLSELCEERARCPVICTEVILVMGGVIGKSRRRKVREEGSRVSSREEDGTAQEVGASKKVSSPQQDAPLALPPVRRLDPAREVVTDCCSGKEEEAGKKNRGAEAVWRLQFGWVPLVSDFKPSRRVCSMMGRRKFYPPSETHR